MSQYTFKYIIVGDTFTGKTSLVNTFINDNVIHYHQSTIGVEFSSKLIEINNNTIKTLIWDTAGLERFRSITKIYYQKSSIAVIVYDVTTRETFKNLEYWYNEIIANCNSNVTIVVVGNKSDLKKREVTYDEGYNFAEKYDLLFFETNIYDKKQTSNIFVESAKLVLHNKVKELDEKSLRENGITVTRNNFKAKNRWCCWY